MSIRTLSKEAKQASDRRMTADPADIAALISGLEEEEWSSTSKDAICGTDYNFDESSVSCLGRESMCTADLVHTVTEMMQEPEEDVENARVYLK